MYGYKYGNRIYELLDQPPDVWVTNCLGTSNTSVKYMIANIRAQMTWRD